MPSEPCTDDFTFTSQPATLLQLPVPPVTAPDAGPLASWLQAQAAAGEEACAIIEEIEAWTKALAGTSCPKNSQWGQLRTIAFQESSIEGMRERIKKLCTDGVSQKQWDKTFKLNGKNTSYSKFLLDTVLQEGTSLAKARQRLYHLGNRVPRRMNQKEQRGEA